MTDGAPIPPISWACSTSSGSIGFHVVGMCIGGPYALGLIDAAQDRVASAVLMQPIGLHENREAFYELFDGWAEALAAAGTSAAALDELKVALFGGDFIFNLAPSFLAACTTPLLILMGNDKYHPESISRAIARLAPRADLIERWKEPERVDLAKAAVAAFLAQHTSV